MTGYRCECGLTFSRITGFDSHRVGTFEQRDRNGVLIRESTRRCLSVAELQERGFLLNERTGAWTMGVSHYTSPASEAPFCAKQPSKNTMCESEPECTIHEVPETA